MMPAYRHDNKLKCIYDVLSCSSEQCRSGWDSGNEKTRLAFSAVIVSAVSITICFQEHPVCLLSLPFVCCQVLVSSVSCDDTQCIIFQTRHSRNVSINQSWYFKPLFTHLRSHRNTRIRTRCRWSPSCSRLSCSFHRNASSTGHGNRRTRFPEHFWALLTSTILTIESKTGSKSFKVDGKAFPNSVQSRSVKII